VVIATENSQTGTGHDILSAAQYLIDQSADPASIFHDRLNTGAVGAIGHSQGAAGVLNAMVASGGLIKTVVPIELPAQMECSSAPSCADPTKLTGGSVFFVNGGDDAVISPSNPPAWAAATGIQSNRGYFDAAPAGTTKTWGTLVRANHNDVEGRPDCGGMWSCTAGVYGYLGYPTAWLTAQLFGDPDARAAFAPGTGEFYAPNANWVNQIGSAAQ
jgi:hypothetical protein